MRKSLLLRGKTLPINSIAGITSITRLNIKLMIVKTRLHKATIRD
jgi:hypothetical protein